MHERRTAIEEELSVDVLVEFDRGDSSSDLPPRSAAWRRIEEHLDLRRLRKQIFWYDDDFLR
jgi:hypothetical protein